MLAKVLEVILMIRYFNNNESIKKTVTLFTLTFKLDGRGHENPITNGITGGSDPAEPTFSI
jgi:hypothetical protein